jgi:hypothetical protein
VKTAAWALSFVVLSGSRLEAQQSLVTDRPDFTESASVVGPGHVQLEGGATFTRSADSDEITLGEVLVRIGVDERLELRAAANSYARIEGADGDAEGLEDPALGVKWLLHEGQQGAAALLVATSVPVGDDEVGSDAWQPEMRLALGRDAGNAALGANLGWEWRKDDRRRHVGLASFTLGLPLGERSGVFLEAYASAAEGAGGQEVYADAGLTRLLSDDLQIDARVGLGLSEDAADWFVGIGAARRW